MHTLTWSQVNAWRLTQHRLVNRGAWDEILSTISAIGGLHAQLMSAAELALCTRVDDILPADLAQALWQLRTVVKTWLMRGTLHLVTTEDYPIYQAALSTLTHYRRNSWLNYHGVTLDELEAILTAVHDNLTATGMTRDRLAYVVSQQTRNPKLQELLLSGWGALLKPAAFLGYLCYGPDYGQNITFVSPRAWIGDWEPVDPQAALAEAGRRYLKAYGPATTDDFSRWLGLTPAQARNVFEGLDTTPVDVEGHQALVLTETLGPMAAQEAVECVRLLPFFDPYTVALSKQRHILMDMQYEKRVFRPQGWIAPVVLVDGLIVGVWEHKRVHDKVDLSVELFEPRTERIEAGIHFEAQRIGAFLESTVAVTIQAAGHG